MDARCGDQLCQQVINAWADRIRSKWPLAESHCPRCLEVLILNGSRLTPEGWKISYHLVYPWLTFSCNNGTLKEEVTALSNLPQFQDTLPDGSAKRFIDSSVYSRHRQFRMALSHKLSDRTQTPLSLPGGPNLQTFLLSCVTQIEPNSWTVPEETIRTTCTTMPSSRIRSRGTVSQFSVDRPPLALGPSPLHPSTIFSLQTLLRRNGLPDGRLNLMRGDDHAASLRWGTNNGLKWSCSIAQIWRPADPFHDGNGGILSFDKTRAVFLKCLHPS